MKEDFNMNEHFILHKSWNFSDFASAVSQHGMFILPEHFL